MNFTQEEISDILIESANRGGTYLRLSQNPNIRPFLSLPKDDSANSERSEESYLCPKSDVRSPKLKVAYLVAACHSERSDKSIPWAIIFWQ